MAGMAETLQDYVAKTTKLVVDEPQSVAVTASVTTKAIIIQIKVDESDCGKIIGKQGRTIEALKILCLAIKNTNFPNDSRRIVIEVLEDEDSSYRFKNTGG